MRSESYKSYETFQVLVWEKPRWKNGAGSEERIKVFPFATQEEAVRFAKRQKGQVEIKRKRVWETPWETVEV